MVHRTFFAAVLCACALATPAWAHPPHPGFAGIGPGGKLFVAPGITLAAGLPLAGDGGGGVVLGGEVSVIHFGEEWLFGGGYVDGVYGWDRRAGRMSVGAVFGYWLGGVDVGYLVDFQGPGPHHGLSVRLFATIGLLSLYARYGFLHDSPDFVEVGLLIKLPFSVLWKRKGEWKSHLRLLGTR